MTDRVLPPTIAELQRDLISGNTTCREIVATYLKRQKETAHLNAYVHLFDKEALSRATELDEVFMANQRTLGKLWGVVVSIKDVISYKDHPISAGSKMLEGYQPIFSATAVQRLLDEDAIIVGVTNCDEFAMGSDNRNSFYGPVSNAINEDHVPGGSSGGAAVSVQTHTCHIALGSDTGGSVRQPASFCNLIGFKPTYGRISRHGLIAYASSFDQIGLIGHHLEDIRRVYDVISGPDHWDSTLLNNAAEKAFDESKKPCVAYIKEALEHHGLQEEIRNAFFRRITALKSIGWKVEEVSLSQFSYIIPTYYVLTSAEASSNLSRYDGIRFGFRAENPTSLHDMYTSSRSQGFGEEVKRRILLGTFVLSVGYYDAYFAKAQKVRRILCEQFDQWYLDYDAILLPTAPTSAWKKDDDLSPVAMYLSDIYSVLANLIGTPSASLPLGFDGDDLPFGLQILTPRTADHTCLSIAEKLQVVD